MQEKDRNTQVLVKNFDKQRQNFKLKQQSFNLDSELKKNMEQAKIFLDEESTLN
jgi:hypothetical protein